MDAHSSVRKNLSQVKDGVVLSGNNFSRLAKFFHISRILGFKLLLKLFPFKYDGLGESFLKRIFHVLRTVIEILQMASLLWYPHDEFEGRLKYRLFWEVLGLTRFDNVCGHFISVSACFYISLSVLVLVLLIALVLLSVSLCRKRECFALENILSKSIQVLGTFLYLPFSCFFFIVFKNYVNKTETVKEYNINADDMEYSIFYILGMFCFLVHNCLAYIYCALCYENRHIKQNMNNQSRSNSKIEKIRIQFLAFICILYSLFGIEYQAAFRGVYGIGSLILSVLYLKFQPFYSSIQNSIQVSNFALISFLALCFEIGDFSKNYDYSFILVLLVGPFWYGIIFFQTNEFIKNSRNGVLSANSVFDFELKIRKKIVDCSPEQFNEIISDFAEYYTSQDHKKSKFLLIWVSNFCYYQMEDDVLARIKLGLPVSEDICLETDFQVFRLRESFKEFSLDYHEDIDYLNFMSKLANATKNDLRLCECISEFIKMSTDPSSFDNLLDKKISELSSLLKITFNLYDSLVKLYPNSASALDLYQSFLDQFLDQTEKSLHFLNKKQHAKSSHIENVKSISYFEEGNGIIIVSGGIKDFSITTYANEMAGQILRQPADTIIGNSISTYVPYPFNANHNQHMLNFLFSCNSAEIKLPLGLFLQTQKGFLVECYIQIKCSALEGSPFFMVLLKEKVTLREVAVVAENGLILNHSENFGKLLAGVFSLKMSHIDEFFDGNVLARVPDFEPIFLQRSGITAALIKSSKRIKKNHQIIVYLITDPQSIEKWVKGKVDKNAQYNNSQKLKGAHLEVRNDYTERVETSAVVKDPRRSSTILDQNKIKDLENKSLNKKSDLENSNVPFSKIRLFDQIFGILSKYSKASCFVFLVLICFQVLIVAFVNTFYHLSAIDLIQDLNETSVTLAQLFTVSRGLHLKTSNPMPNPDDLEVFINISSRLSTSKYALIKHGEDSICESLKHSSIHLTLNDSTTKNRLNTDYIQHIIENMNEYQFNNSPGSLARIIASSVALSNYYQELSKTVNDCAISDIIESKNQLMIFGLANLILCLSCFSIIIYVMTLITKKYSLIVKIFYKSLMQYKRKLHQIVKLRLIEIHKSAKNDSSSDETEKTVLKSNSISQKLGMFWVFIVRSIIITGFYLIVYLTIIPRLDTLIQMQGKSLKYDSDLRIGIYKLNFWIREKVLNNQELIFDEERGFYGISQNEIEETQKQLLQIQHFYSSKDFVKTISQSKYSDFYTKGNERENGIYLSVNSIILDSFQIDSNSNSIELKNFQNKIDLFENKCYTLGKYFLNDIYLVFSDVKTIGVICSNIYIIFSFILFTIVFQSTVLSLFRKIKNVQKFCEIIPIKSNPEANLTELSII